MCQDSLHRKATLVLSVSVNAIFVHNKIDSGLHLYMINSCGKWDISHIVDDQTEEEMSPHGREAFVTSLLAAHSFMHSTGNNC
jgi:hypothetical protein